MDDSSNSEKDPSEDVEIREDADENTPPTIENSLEPDVVEEVLAKAEAMAAEATATA